MKKLNTCIYRTLCFVFLDDHKVIMLSVTKCILNYNRFVAWFQFLSNFSILLPLKLECLP